MPTLKNGSSMSSSNDRVAAVDVKPDVLSISPETEVLTIVASTERLLEIEKEVSPNREPNVIEQVVENGNDVGAIEVTRNEYIIHEEAGNGKDASNEEVSENGKEALNEDGEAGSNKVTTAANDEIVNGKKIISSEEEAKARLAEKRREMKEKKEREAELERQRLVSQ